MQPADRRHAGAAGLKSAGMSVTTPVMLDGEIAASHAPSFIPIHAVSGGVCSSCSLTRHNTSITMSRWPGASRQAPRNPATFSLAQARSSLTSCRNSTCTPISASQMCAKAMAAPLHTSRYLAAWPQCGIHTDRAYTLPLQQGIHENMQLITAAGCQTLQHAESMSPLI